MNRCKDCESWSNIEYTEMGLCSRLGKRVTPRLKGHPVGVEVHQGFGCVSFKEKQQGPFRVEFISSKYMVCHKSANMGRVGTFEKAEKAESFAELLNHLWKLKEQKDEPESCENCGISDNCFHRQFRTGYGWCNHWSPKCSSEKSVKNCFVCTLKCIDDNCPFFHSQEVRENLYCEKFKRRTRHNCGTCATCARGPCPCDEWSSK